MKIACAEALAALAREDVPDEVAVAYGKELIWEKLHHPHLLTPSYSPHSPSSGPCGNGNRAARRPIIDMESYELSLKHGWTPASILVA